MKMSIPNLALIVAGLTAGAAVAQGASKTPPAPKVAAVPAKPADDADRALVEKQCGGCHGIDQVTAKTRNASEWAETIDQMINYGAQLSAEDNKRITEFLIAHYGPKDGAKKP